MASALWTARASDFRLVLAKPHHSVEFHRLWMAVDKWISGG
jgi:hypothetical protein